MKTGMEYPFIGLLVLLAAVVLYNAWSSIQVDVAVAGVNATIAGERAPEAVMIGGEWLVKALVGAVIGGAVTAFFAALIVWVKRQWEQAKSQGQWKGGPNAQWQQPRAPKPMSQAELMQLWMMQQMAGQAAKPARRANARMVEDDDEPTFTF